MGKHRVKSSRSVTGMHPYILLNIIFILLVVISAAAYPHPHVHPPTATAMPVLEGEICWDIHAHAGVSDGDATRVKRDVAESDLEYESETEETTDAEEAESETTTVRDRRLQEAVDIISKLFPKRCRSIRNKFPHSTDCTKYITCADIKGDGNLDEMEVDCPPGEMFDDTLTEIEAHLHGCVNPTSMSPKARCFPEVQKLLNEEDLDLDSVSSTPSSPSTSSSEGTFSPSYVYGFVSANPEVAAAICILLFILLISVCFLCCYLLRIIYECAFMKSPPKGHRVVPGSGSGSGRLESRSHSSRSSTSRSSSRSQTQTRSSSKKCEPLSFRRFQATETNRDGDGDGDSIELKSVTFLRSNSGFPSPPDAPRPNECSTLEIRGSRTQKQVEFQSAYAWPWQVDSNTETSTEVIVTTPCAGGYEPRITNAVTAVTASSTGTATGSNAPTSTGRSSSRKKVEIYIPNLNLPNALEPYHVKTLFEEGDVDENYFGVMESNAVGRVEGYQGFGEDDEGYQIVPNLSPPPLYDAVIPRHKRNQNQVGPLAMAAMTTPEPPTPPPPPPEPEPETCSCDGDGDGDGDRVDPDPGEKRWSTFGKLVQVPAPVVGDGSKKSSVIVLEPVNGVPGAGPDRVLEYFF